MPKNKIRRFKPYRNLSTIKLVNFVLLFSIIGTLYLLLASAALVDGMWGTYETDQLNRINAWRTQNGKAGTKHTECLNQVAEDWAKTMAQNSVGTRSADGKYVYFTFSHNPNLGSQVGSKCGGYSAAGEIIGADPYRPDDISGSSAAIFDGFKNSASHNNIMLGSFSYSGHGAYRLAKTFEGKNYNVWYVVNVFASGTPNTTPATVSDPAIQAPATEITHLLRNSNTGGAPTISFKYGMSDYTALYCDWDGNGTDTVGVYTNGWWYLRNSNTAGAPDIIINYGAAGYRPVCGDWDGNGTDTIGVYAGAGWWHLRNSNTPGVPNINVQYGASNYKPVVGDWDGNGTDTIGVVTPGSKDTMVWLLRNSNTGGAPQISVSYGVFSSYKPVVGDWDGNGTDTIGVYAGAGWWHLRNSNTPGVPNINVQYGASNYTPVVGDFDGNKTSTIGVLTP